MRIKEIAKEKGLSISELANIMGVKQESLSRAINGNPTLETLEKIAKALDVNIYDLFEKPSIKEDSDFKCPNCGAKLAITEI